MTKKKSSGKGMSAAAFGAQSFHSSIRKYAKVRGAGRHQFEIVPVVVLQRETRSEPVLVPRKDLETGGTDYDRVDGEREYALISESGKRPRWVYASELQGDTRCD